MFVWINNFTCPGFFFYPCKPHKNGNKYHSIFCGESGIMYRWDIFEGRYHPIPMGRSQFITSTKLKMVGLMIQLT